MPALLPVSAKPTVIAKVNSANNQRVATLDTGLRQQRQHRHAANGQIIARYVARVLASRNVPSSRHEYTRTVN